MKSMSDKNIHCKKKNYFFASFNNDRRLSLDDKTKDCVAGSTFVTWGYTSRIIFTVKICIFKGSDEKINFSKTKAHFPKKTTPQLLGDIGLKNMKVGVKSNFGRWILTSSLKMTEQINMTCQSVYYHLHNIRQIRKFLTPASTKLLVQGVIMAGIDYLHWLCVFPNYNVFSILLRDLSPIHPDTVILPHCCLHCIGYRWSSEFAIKSLWSLSRLFTIWGLRF